MTGGRDVPVGEERERRWAEFVAMYPQARYYAQFTDRELPPIALEPGPPDR